MTVLGLAQETAKAEVPVVPEPSITMPDDPKHRKDVESDIRIGKEYTTELEKGLKFSKDKAGIERLEHVGSVLARIAQKQSVKVLFGDPRLNPFPYRFKLLEDPDVNAFSVPGGSIYVNEGLLKFCESDDELAAVLGHEISHAAFRHYATLEKKSSWISALSLPILLAAILAKSDAAYGAAMATNMAGQAYVSGWSVEAEASSDFGAIQYLQSSPYNPVAMLTFMERLSARDSVMGSQDWTIYTTHPPSPLRARTIYQELKKLEIPIKRSLVTRSLSSRIETRQDGFVELYFGSTKVFTFGGADASSRAAIASARLNDFFDRVPELYEISSDPDGTLYGKGRELFRVMSVDTLNPDSARQNALAALRTAAFDISLKVTNQTRG